MPGKHDEMRELVDFVEKVINASEVQPPQQTRALSAVLAAEVVAEVSAPAASKVLLEAIDPGARALADKIASSLTAQS